MRSLSEREQAFVISLKRHGFRFLETRSGKYLKRKKGYVFLSSAREEASGIDFWVKMPGEHKILPVQVTQRGSRLRKNILVS